MSRITENWREWWRHWSTWLIGVGSSVATFAPEVSEAILHAWSIVPLDVKSVFEPQVVRYIGYAVALLAIPAKFVKQKSLNRDVAQ